LPEKVSGSDLLVPLLERAAASKLRVFLLGGKPDVATRAEAKLHQRIAGLRVVGRYSPPQGFEGIAGADDETIARVRAARPNLLVVAFGCPRQELWMHRHWRAFAPAVAIGVGATLDFIAGEQRRAPPWMSRVGLEWLHRLSLVAQPAAARVPLPGARSGVLGDCVADVAAGASGAASAS
jgi:N-acetylglucosaminyldiphosphoundecaprenol N-acetyl-beta-D-mannosaminyltransferase